MDVAWAIAGVGPRRWQALDERGVGEGQCLYLPAAAVRVRRRLRLDPQQPRRSALRILRQLDRDRQRGLAVAGWLAYEVGAALEGRVPASAASWADAAWLAFDPADLEVETLHPASPPAHVELPSALAGQGDAFTAAATDILTRIAAGEVYQVNLTVEARLPWQRAVAPLQAVSAVMACQPVPLAMAWRDRQFALVSGSMERFLSVRDGLVRSRPIKGTTARGDTAAHDAAQARWLQTQPKERAENTMIVDMVRNDLQRACLAGSISVPVALHPEPYATLWHLESEVSGRLQAAQALAPLLATTLPPASVTGCPKVQAMDVIATHERRRRGPYCGALGVAWPDGSSDWAVAIRSAWFDGGSVSFAVGAGLVAASQPDAEWQETCLKARAVLRTLSLLRGEGSWN